MSEQEIDEFLAKIPREKAYDVWNKMKDLLYGFKICSHCGSDKPCFCWNDE